MGACAGTEGGRGSLPARWEPKPYWSSARVCRDSGWRKELCQGQVLGCGGRVLVQSRGFSFSKAGRAFPVIVGDEQGTAAYAKLQAALEVGKQM